MGRYASETTVPVERSRADIEKTLRRYGASEFHSGWKQDSAMIGFRLRDLFIRFVIPFPSQTDESITHKTDRHGYEVKRTDGQISAAYEQEIRQRWRALLLVIKAKLEAVECAISTVEHEFLAFIVMPNSLTVGEWMIDQAMPSIKAGRMPPLMLAGPAKDNAVDAEIVS